MNSVPPMTSTRCPAGSWRFDPLVVILEAKVRDQILSSHPAQRILQLHELDENVVLGIQAGRRHRTFEIEGEPLLNAFHSRALREIEKQHQVEYQGRCQYRVPAEKVDLDLHRIAEPAKDVDVIPAFFGIAPRRV